MCFKIFEVNYEYPNPLLHGMWYVGTKDSQLRGVKKLYKNTSFLISTIQFLYTPFITKIHRFSKRFLRSTVDV